MLVLHFDYTSLAAAVAVLRFQALADAGGAVAFQGIDVLGLDVSLPVTLDQLDEIRRWSDRADAQGLDVRTPSRRPPTLDAHVIGQIAATHGLGAAWREVVLRAYWTHGAAIDDRGVLTDLSRQAGLSSGDVAERFADERARIALRQRMTAERGRGIGGVPIIEFDGTLLPGELPDEDLRLLAGL